MYVFSIPNHYYFMHDVLRLNQPCMKNPKISNFVARFSDINRWSIIYNTF